MNKYRKLPEGKISFCVNAEELTDQQLSYLQNAVVNKGYCLDEGYAEKGVVTEHTMTFRLGVYPFWGVSCSDLVRVYDCPEDFDLPTPVSFDEAMHLLDKGCLPEEKGSHFPEEVVVGGKTYKVSYEEVKKDWWEDLPPGNYLINTVLGVRLVYIDTETKTYHVAGAPADCWPTNDLRNHQPLANTSDIKNLLVDTSILEGVC